LFDFSFEFGTEFDHVTRDVLYLKTTTEAILWQFCIGQANFIQTEQRTTKLTDRFSKTQAMLDFVW